jgi:mRNA-degrading endonuclease RelE of RelBE toxin-antitoxin system
MFQIEFTKKAREDLQYFRVYEQKEILNAIKNSLKEQASNVSSNRKKLRPNDLAEWELRVDKFRIFYDVNIECYLVTIVAIAKKRANILYIQGRSFVL